MQSTVLSLVEQEREILWRALFSQKALKAQAQIDQGHPFYACCGSRIVRG